MEKENFTTVSFEELWSELSGSTQFGQDELIEMISLQDDEEKDFCIYHRHKAFRVPLDKIREFFTRHTKPVPPMTKDQELKYLREKVNKLQNEAEQFQAEGKVSRPAPDEPEEDTKVAEEAELSPVIESNVPVTKEKIIPPKRDESIPPLQERKKESVKEVRARLAKELKEDKVNPAKQKLMDSAIPKDIPRAPKE